MGGLVRGGNIGILARLTSQCLQTPHIDAGRDAQVRGGRADERTSWISVSSQDRRRRPPPGRSTAALWPDAAVLAEWTQLCRTPTPDASRDAVRLRC